MSVYQETLSRNYSEIRSRLFPARPPQRYNPPAAPVQIEIKEAAPVELPVPVRLKHGLSIKRIIWTVVKYFPDVTSGEITGPRRQKQIIVPRHLAMYLTKELLPSKSLPEIGRLFGGRDHTTALHACRKTKVRLARDVDLAKIYELIRAELIEAKTEIVAIQSKADVI
jgi:hypothetical protein